MLDDDLDAQVAMRAKIDGISKSEVVRRILRAEFPTLPPIEEDPIWDMVGADPDVEPANVDDVVYGPVEAD